jgi:hypothetical protein
LARCSGQGKSSQLCKRLVYDDQIATDGRAFNSAQEIAGQFRIQATARPGDDVTKAEKAIEDLKFSVCLPARLAQFTLFLRLSDEGTRLILR